MPTTNYPSDITEREWQIIEPLLPPLCQEGRPRKYNLRDVVNAILYVEKNDCSWRKLPEEFPDWQSVYGYIRRWRRDKTWEKIQQILSAPSSMPLPPSKNDGQLHPS